MNWNAIESMAVVCSAVFTAVMAFMTYKTIVESRRQHKDNYRPILVLASKDGVAPVRREDFVTVEPSQGGKSGGDFLVGGVLQNVGSGPALDARLTIRFQGLEGYGGASELAPVRAGGNYGKAENPLRVAVTFGRDFNDTDFGSVLGSGWDILLEYRDVFGQVFHTVHTKDPWKLWTVTGKGAAPRGESRQSYARRLAQSVAADPINAAD